MVAEACLQSPAEGHCGEEEELGWVHSKDQASAVLQAKQRQGCQELHACPTNTQVNKTDL